MLLRTEVYVVTLLAATSTALARRVDWREERGDVTSTTVLVAILATLALAVGAIIVTKVTQKANSIPTK